MKKYKNTSVCLRPSDLQDLARIAGRISTQTGTTVTVSQLVRTLVSNAIAMHQVNDESSNPDEEQLTCPG